MKTRKNSKWSAHPDVGAEAALNSQIWMADALRRVGSLEDFSRGVMANGAPRLDPSHCQFHAMAKRRHYERDAFALLSEVPDGCIAVMFTAVVSEKLQKRPFKQSEVGSFQHYLCERLTGSEEIIDFVGVYEADYLSGEGRFGWVLTLHGVVTVKASNFRSASRAVHDLIDLTSNAIAYRPVLVRQIHDLAGALRYIFKSFSAPSIVERASWFGETVDGKPRRFSRKLRLKTPQLRQLSKSLVKESLDERVIWSSRRAR
ncbi:hypothetical protein OIU13_00030 [Brevundimonas sp. BT-123]|uniref:hypothetical protein n=1 Tax=Brevundimonas sp. BT-123 TaxID=2986928 RepID=UPI002235B707|nr:hypothetical protein [Brevundimonas sp. BT-123]MCW0044926.1 hypothetical protein [Brevundimonas sp. BT-123]